MAEKFTWHYKMCAEHGHSLKIITIVLNLNVGYNTIFRERSGSVVECLTRDLEAAGSSLTGVTALCP